MGADELLSSGVGSAVAEATEAVLTMGPATAGARTTTVMVGAVLPLARVGRVQETLTSPWAVHAQPSPAADTKATPAGSVSSTSTATAASGPALETTSV